MEWRPHILFSHRKQTNITKSNHSSRIDRRAEQGSRPTEPPQAVVEKLATEKNEKNEN